MKKTLLTLLLALGVVAAANAQNEREKGVYTKKGYQILPQAGDFAIGIDANPFLNYGIGLFSGSAAPTFDGYGGNIYGKYFLKDNQAIRAKLFIGMNNTSRKFEILDDVAAAASTPDLDARVVDVRKIGNTTFGLAGGYEWRRGYGRLQAFYGGEFGFRVTSSKTTYKWGNEITKDNTNPTTVSDWDAEDGDPGAASVRTLWTKNATAFTMQLGAFAGVEYFFARKMSIGAELGLGLRMRTAGQGKAETETWNTVDNVVETEETKAAFKGQSRFNFSTPVSGNIFLMFHF